MAWHGLTHSSDVPPSHTGYAVSVTSILRKPGHACLLFCLLRLHEDAVITGWAGLRLCWVSAERGRKKITPIIATCVRERRRERCGPNRLAGTSEKRSNYSHALLSVAVSAGVCVSHRGDWKTQTTILVNDAGVELALGWGVYHLPSTG